MRIFITINCKWWNAASQGAALTGSALLRQGHEVLIQTGSGGPVSARLKELGLPSRELRNLSIGLRGAVRDFKADVVIAFRSDGQTAAAMTLSGVPLVRYRSDQRKARGGRLWQTVDSRTTLMVFPGKSMVEKGFQGPRRGRTAVIPQPVDTEWYNNSHRSPEKTILSLARLSPVKGHKTLIKAMTLVRDDYRAVIAGKDAQYTAGVLTEFAESLGVSHRIEFAGRVEDVRPLLKRADVGVITSLGSEAVSRAGMEMMSSGVPLAAASTNGLLDLVTDGVNGVLHSPGNWKQLASQINHLTENRGLSRYLAGNARKFCVEKLSPEAVGQLWTKHLEQVCFG